MASMSMVKKLLEKDCTNCVILEIERSKRAIRVPVTWLS